MCVEEKLEKIEKNNSLIMQLIKENQLLSKQLLEEGAEEWDYCSVQNASIKTSIPAPTLYKKIEKGELNPKKIGTKIFIKVTDIKKLLKD